MPGNIALPAVWFVQPSIQHYRVPVWDRVQELAAGSYRIHIFGEMQNGRAFHGPAREYFSPLQCLTRRTWGIRGPEWPELMERVAQGPPAVVVMAANIRSRTCWRFPRLAKPRSIKTIAWSKVHSFSPLPNWLLNPVKSRFFHSFDRCIAYGELARRELRSLGITENLIDVAQNTIDTRSIFTDGDRFRSRGEALRREHSLEGSRLLLCIGRMDPEKRHADLIRAWPRLREVSPHLRLVLVGGGKGLDSIKAFANQIDQDRVVVTGPAADGDDYAWIATSDITIQPGAVGLAINQSLAFGVPTIIADEVGSDTEIVVHGQTGWRYPRGNLDAMVKMIAEVLSNPDATNRVASAGRALMRDTVTLDNMAAAIDRSISQCLP